MQAKVATQLRNSRLTPSGSNKVAVARSHRRTMSQRTASNVAHASSSTAAPADDMGTIVEPSYVNKSPVRIAAILAACAAGGIGGFGTSFVPSTLAIVAHLLATGLWVGVNVWTTFFAGITMFRNLERRTFGKLQSKLFPLYFAVTTVCGAVLLGTLGTFEGAVSDRVLYTLILGLVTSLCNLLLIEPKATQIMFERYTLEDSGKRDEDAQSARKQLTKKFGMFHGLSSLANLGNLIAAVAHVTWLGTLLQRAVV